MVTIHRRGLDGEANSPMSEARFRHDCHACVFLGNLDGRDVYACPQAGFPTIVARYGNDGPEYASGAHLVDELLTGPTRARALGARALELMNGWRRERREGVFGE